MQGMPTVVASLAKGIPVRALVRDATTAIARDIAALGAELAIGTFEDAASLDRAMSGVRSVFSLQLAHPELAEVQQKALVAAAQRHGVQQFVQSTVSATGTHRSFPDWEKGRWLDWYWIQKEEQEQRVREAGFKYWTMVRPAMLMDNFLPYRAKFMHPELISRGNLLGATRAHVPIAYVSSETVGAAGAAALADPARFHGKMLELADDMVSLNRIAETLKDVTGKSVTVTYESVEQSVARGVFWGIGSAQDWLNVVGYPARPEMLAGEGLTPLPFRRWAERHASEFEIGKPA